MAEGLNTSLYADSSLQCYYRFNSGALTTDSKGSLTLTSSGSPADTTGKFGNAVSLDTSAYYSRSTALTANGDSFSVNCWIKDFPAGAIFSTRCGSYEFYIQKRDDISKVVIHLEYTSGIADYNGSYPAGWNNTLWQMVTVTVEQAGADVISKIYLNKELVSNNTATTKTIRGLESPYSLCHFYVEGKNGSNGKIDDFMFFKNKVLTTTEIEQLYVDNGGSFIFNMI